MLAGFLIAYLNIDEVIRIIRFEDHPKQALMARWDLSDEQAEAILNIRLRALHKLEQLAIEKETAELQAEKAKLEALLADPAKRWKAIDKELVQLKAEFGQGTPRGARRTEIGGPPGEIAVPVHAFVEREPVTVLCSAKGWIRTVKGHNVPLGDQRYKEGDGPRFSVEAQTTDRILVFANTGRFYTLGVDKLPGGRGMGEPLRLMIDLPNDADIVTLLPYREGQKLLLISSDGRGFLAAQDEAAAQTRAGKQVMNPSDGAVARWCFAVGGEGAPDAVGLLGENRKLLVLPLDEIADMQRGRGVILQKYRDGGLADVRMLKLAEGISWQSGSRTRSEPDLTAWRTGRGSSGRMAPTGFPQKPVKFP